MKLNIIKNEKKRVQTNYKNLKKTRDVNTVPSERWIFEKGRKRNRENDNKKRREQKNNELK